MHELEKVSIDAGSKIFGLLKGMSLRPEFALAEFVDNSLGSYLKHKKALAKTQKDFILEVTVNIDTVSEVITIKDNAFGIDQEDLSTALTIGASSKGSEMNEFGIGMKLAGFWFASDWELRTKALDEPWEKSLKFNVLQLEEDDTTEVLISYRNVKHNDSYTEITLSKFNDGRFPGKLVRNKVEMVLKEMYRRYYENNEMKLFFVVDDKELLLKNEKRPILNMPFLNKKQNPMHEWKVPIKFSRDKYKISGWVGLLEKSKIDSAGFDLFRRNRLVEWKWKPRKEESEFNIFGGKRSEADARLFGEFDFTNFDVTSNKNEIQWPPDLKEEFLEHIYFSIHYQKKMGKGGKAVLHDFWSMLENYKALNKVIKNPESPEDFKQEAIDTVQIKLEVVHDQEEPIIDKNSFEDSEPPLSKDLDLDGKTFEFPVTVTDDEKWLVKAILNKGKSSDPFFSFNSEKTDKWPRELTMRMNISHPYFKLIVSDQDTFADKGGDLIALYSYMCIMEQYALDDAKPISPSFFRVRINKLLSSLYG